MLKKLLFTALVCFVMQANNASAQAPTDNPYRTRFNPSIFHWTDSLKWASVTNVTTVSGLLGSGNQVDSTAMQTLMNQISAQGGGVIYFPADTFRFAYDLIIPGGVLIRGANPTVANALDDNYRPATIFQFPKYIPTFSGNGTPNNTAFKSVKGKVNAGNIALVNLDINRAHIGFHPENWTDAPGVNTKWPVDINFNILAFGIRSNNVAIPSPQVPAPASGNDPAQEGWQRFVWRFTANIGFYVSRNGVIANCRVNDEPTDTYNQPGYVIRAATNGNCFAAGLSKLNPDGSDAKFEYTDHIGIDLNRAKINKDGAGSGSGPNGKYGIYGFVTYATPASEPQLFAPGNEIRDCYVYKTRRVGIIAAGNGLIVDNNKVRDRFNKIAFIRADGTGCETNNSATHENRGMDVSGWNVYATRNDIEVQQHRIGGPSGYPSVDGEGILVQECCGGTSVKDYIFKFNKLTQASTGYIGLWKMRTMYNVHIDSNDLGCKNIFLTANTNGASFGLFNSTIKGNTNLNNISSNAGTGGSNFVISGNSFCGSGTIQAPGFATVIDNGGATVDPGPGSVVAVPTISILLPTNNEFYEANSLVVISLQTTDADSVRYYVNSTLMTPFTAGSTSSFNWTANVPSGNYFITAEAKNANGAVFSNTVMVRIGVLSNKPNLTAFPISVFPNPSSGLFQVSYPEMAGQASFELIDFTGKSVLKGSLNTSKTISIMDLSPGMYQLKIMQGNLQSRTTLIKQ
jgi:hypothetical protein